MLTNVNHWFVWCGRDSTGNPDFGAQALLEEKHGIGLDANYAHYDNQSSQGQDYLGQPGSKQGNFTGSGLVMKYATVSGRVTNVYQHVNAVYDQQYTERHDPEGFYACFHGLADRSLNGDVYSVIGIKAHNDEYYFSKLPLMRMLGFARENNVPVWTEKKLLEFLSARENASFEGIRWKGNTLTFRLNSKTGPANHLSLLLPAVFNKSSLIGLHVDGNDMPVELFRVRGNTYAILTVTSGSSQMVEAYYAPQ
jgi:hypothetical protein